MSQPAPQIDQFRRRFHEARLALVRAHGPQTFDEAHVLYSGSERPVVVRDAFPPDHSTGGAVGYLTHLNEGWWLRRQQFRGTSDDPKALTALRGLYARYLPEVGFDYSIEFGPEGPVCAWRMNARGQVQRLRLPTDDQMFHEQTGTFLDVRAAWRDLVTATERTGTVTVTEVQPGYLIGVRPGVPGDPAPAEREDEALAIAMEPWNRRDFDTLEFLADETSARYPFHGDRYREWLPGPHADAADAGQIELFVVADASEFLACIEDLASRSGIAVQWIDPESHLRVALIHGPLRLELAFDYPFLRSLHTGRTFAQGVCDFYGPAVDAIDDAKSLYDQVEATVDGTRYALAIEQDTVLVVREHGDELPLGRWNLMGLAGRMHFQGTAGRAELLAFLGYDEQSNRFAPRTISLDTCPVCGSRAHVNKVVRPVAHVGVDPRTLAGVPLGEHIVYYTVDCPTHSSPIEPGRGRDLETLESAYRDGLPHSVVTLLASEKLADLAESVLLVGFDVGSLVLEPARLKAALVATGDSGEGERAIYAFYPDAMVVARKPLDQRSIRRARLAALEAVRPLFPGRCAALDVVRNVNLPDAAVGSIVRG